MRFWLNEIVIIRMTPKFNYVENVSVDYPDVAIQWNVRGHSLFILSRSQYIVCSLIALAGRYGKYPELARLIDYAVVAASVWWELF